MSELRQDILTGNWAVMAPERGKKPESFKVSKDKDLREYDSYDSKCPFCSGNEEKFEIIPLSEKKDDAGNWTTRLIENKYKIFDDYASCPATPEPFTQDGIHTSYQGCGNHYLVIDNPIHNCVMGQMTIAGVKSVFECYQEALTMLGKNPNNIIGIIFKNQGMLAGGSQAHAHSQIVGSRVVPSWVRSALHAQEKYFDGHGICAMCNMLKYEKEAGERVAFENDNCLVMSPYAAGTPYEMWVVPKRHMAWYGNISDDEMTDLAEGVLKVLAAYVESLDNPDFNYFLHSVPTPLAGIPYYHMFVQIVPRLWNNGGFEMGTRIPVNPVLPEDALSIF
jgi:UDPglucose--hexose-1-phosphate uridylyltransferase